MRPDGARSDLNASGAASPDSGPRVEAITRSEALDIIAELPASLAAFCRDRLPSSESITLQRLNALLEAAYEWEAEAAQALDRAGDQPIGLGGADSLSEK